jgi:hypothetical protein
MIDESSKLDDPMEDPIDEFEHVLLTIGHFKIQTTPPPKNAKKRQKQDAK